MESMDINLAVVKALRAERAWSQEQLASISGLSHRTMQRIENTGKCSLDSQKALAAAFDITPGDLLVSRGSVKDSNKGSNKDFDKNPDKIEQKTLKGISMGFRAGLLGILLGGAGAYAGITHSLLSNTMSSQQAGIYYGGIACVVGIGCAVLSTLKHRLSEAKTKQ